jgi:4-amino-4-deoxy-L-arabinose transferase-like glycosyltransferase
MKPMSRKQIAFDLFLIIFVAAVLRGLFLVQNPFGFHYDEAFAGYNAWSILKTGKTVHGHTMPLYVDTFGDYRPMGMVYAIVPFVATLGLSELATRLPAALMGMLIPVLFYGFLYRLTAHRALSLTAALMVSFSPWLTILSRSSSETVMAILVVVAISWVILEYLKTKKLFWLPLLYVFLVISAFTYTAINVFIILFLPVYLFFLWRAFKSFSQIRHLIGVYVLYLLFPIAFGIFFGHATGRASQVVSLFGDSIKQMTQDQIIESPAGTPSLYVRGLHNKVANGLIEFGHRYSDYFSLNFLLFDGGYPNRYYIPESGLINVIEALGLVLSFLLLVSIPKRYRYVSLIFLSWLLLAPLAAALTTDDHPNMSRASMMMPAIQGLAALGIIQLFQLATRRASMMVIPGATILFVVTAWHYIYFYDQYFIHLRFDEWLYRNFSTREAVKVMRQIPPDKTVLASKYFLDTHIYLLFFHQIDPTIAQMAYAQSQQTDQMKINNYTFTDTNCATKDELAFNGDFDFYLDGAHCDEPDWSAVTYLPQPNGDVGAKLLYRRIISPTEWSDNKSKYTKTE